MRSLYVVALAAVLFSGALCAQYNATLQGGTSEYQNRDIGGPLNNHYRELNSHFIENVPIGFEFTYFGERYTHVQVCDRGFVGFDPRSAYPANPFPPSSSATPLPDAPSPNNAIFVAWSGNYPSSNNTKGLFWQTLGTAGSREFRVQYRFWGFSAILSLFEGTNVIQVVFGPWYSIYAGYCGLENKGGTIGIPSPSGWYNYPLPVEGTLITYTPVSAPEVDLANPDDVTISDGATDTVYFGIPTTPFARTFTIRNLGDQNVTFSGSPIVNVVAQNNCTASVTSQPGTSTLAPGASTTCTVQVTPSSAGAFSTDLLFQCNDSDEMVYNWSIGGTAVTGGAPEIELLDPNGFGVANSGSYRHYPLETDLMNFTLTFSVRNLGGAALTFSGSPIVTTSSPTGGTATVTTDLPASVSPGASASFVVTVNSDATSTAYSFNVAFNCNDADESSYQFSVSGWAYDLAQPYVVRSGKLVDDNQLDDVVTGTISGIPTILTYQIWNSGYANVNLQGGPTVNITSTANCVASVTASPTSPVAGQSNTSFSISVNPTTPGAWSFHVDFDYDYGSSPSSYDFTVSGTANPQAPEIDLQRPTGNSIQDGGVDSTTGSIAGSPMVLNYTIENSGTSTMVLPGTPRVAIANQNNCAATVTTQPPMNIGAGVQTALVISVTPSTAAFWSFQFSIDNNDANENPYNITVTGTAGSSSGPEIELEGPGAVPIATGGNFNAGSTPVSTPTNVVFTVRNIGATTLNLTGGTLVVVSGTTNCSANVTVNPASSIAPSGSTTFTVQYNVSTAAAFSFSLSIANDDSNENPYTFTANGSGTAAPEPEMDVEDGVATPIAVSSNYSVGSITAGSATPLTLTIRNTGSATLNLSGTPAVQLSGQSNVSASVTTQPSSSIGISSSSNFTLSINPTASGSFSFSVGIANDDSDENPYTFTVSGTGLSPEISLEDPGSTPLADGGSFAAGNVPVGGDTDFVFTIFNTGNVNLSLTGVPTVSIQSSSNVSAVLFAAPANPIAPTGSTGFTLRVNPLAAGAFSFDVVIANNDLDEDPYNFSFGGTGTEPEMDLDDPSTAALASGGNYAAGNVTVGTPANLVFTIHNNGAANLNLTGTPAVQISSQVNVSATLTVVPSLSITPSGQTMFTIQVSPAASGAFSFSASIDNNDTNENPYTFTVSGTGVPPATPEMELQRLGGSAVADGGTDNLGNVSVLSASNFTWQIDNVGTLALTLSGVPQVQISGSSNVTAVVTSNPAGSVAPSGNTTFSIDVQPTAPGAFSFNVSIANDDPNENPYDFTVSGTGTAPEIEIERTGGAVVLDGGTDAIGSFLLGSTSNLSWTIRNLGSEDLILSGGSPVSVSGQTNCSASVLTNPVSPVAASGSTSFIIQFQPATSGAFAFVVQVASNDVDEATYTINVQGTATSLVPQFQLREIFGGSLIATGTSLDVGDVPVGSNHDVYLRITNAGSATLVLTGTPHVTIGTATSCTASVVTQPPYTLLGPGASQDFVVRVTATAAAGFSAQLQIPTNDGAVGTYTCNIVGTGIAPEIELRRPLTTIIPSGGASDVGGVPVAQSVRLQWAIANIGTGDLHLTPPTPASLDGTPTNCAAVVKQPLSNTIAPGDVGVVSVDVTVFAAGAFSIPMRIQSDDADESDYTFTITGTGTTIVPLLFTHMRIDFGDVEIDKVSQRTLVVENQGTQTLTISSITLAAPSGGYLYAGSTPAGAVGGLPATNVTLLPGDAIGLTFDFVAGSVPGQTFIGTLTSTSDTGGTGGTQTLVAFRGRSVAKHGGSGGKKDENCSTGEGQSQQWLALLAVLAGLGAATRLCRRVE